MDTALIVMALGPRSRALGLLVTEAHRAATPQTPFAIDMPGVSCPVWATRHSWPLGRFGILYGPEDYCESVREKLLAAAAQAPFDAAFTAVQPAPTSVVVERFSSGKSVYVVRRPLRRISTSSREKVAKRLQDHLVSRHGQAPDDIYPVERCGFDSEGRFVVTLHPRHKYERTTRNILHIHSATTGGYFANLVERLPCDAKPFNGQRDAYGFAARVSADNGANGLFADVAPGAVSVPDLDHEKMMKDFLG